MTQQNRGLTQRVLEQIVKHGPQEYAEISYALCGGDGSIEAKAVSKAAGELVAKGWANKRTEQAGSTRVIVLSATPAGKARVQNGHMGGKSAAENAKASDEAEKRMDVIGQNGNEGTHYPKDLAPLARIMQLENQIEKLQAKLKEAQDSLEECQRDQMKGVTLASSVTMKKPQGYACMIGETEIFKTQEEARKAAEEAFASEVILSRVHVVAILDTAEMKMVWGN